MRGIEQLEQAVSDARAAHTGAMGRLLAAEKRHDTARTPWGREKARKTVLRLIGEVRQSEGIYRGAQLDLALMRWDHATTEARKAEGRARRAVDLGKDPATINAAYEARDAAVAAIEVAADLVEKWKPVP